MSVSTAVLPDGWRERLVRWGNNSTGRAEALFLEKHDLVVSKLAAMRAKDLTFASALIEAELVSVATLRERVEQLPVDTDPRVGERLRPWLESW